MKQFNGLVKRVAGILDKLAGGCFFLVMVLILGNILMRSFLGMPILGTYEIVGFLTALGIGLALAHCALQDGHIAVTLFTDRLSGNFQALIQVLVNGVSCLFWGAAAWHLVLFAQAMKIKGLVSPSAEIPVYPFIYLIAVGVAGLSLALIYQLILSCRELAAARSWPGKTLAPGAVGMDAAFDPVFNTGIDPVFDSGIEPVMKPVIEPVKRAAK